MRLKEVLCSQFQEEYTAAQEECNRLAQMFREVCWYNFETKCRTWRRPWPESWGDSPIELLGMRFAKRPGRREVGTFPVYYSGTIGDAPCLPPIIIMKEMRLAAEYLADCREQCTAPHDWAPGGHKYLDLAASTKVGKSF